MRILHVNETLGFLGGAERYLFDVVSGLNARGHENFLLYEREADIDNSQYKEEFSAYTTLENFGNNIEKLLDTCGPNIILIHRWPTIETLLPLIVKLPTFRFIHDHDLYCLRRSKFFYLSGAICHYPIGVSCFFCLPFSKSYGVLNIQKWPRAIPSIKYEFHLNSEHLSFAFVASQFMKDELVRNGFPSGKIKVLPLFTGIPDAMVPFQNATPSILFVGQILRGKGLDLLLQAFSTIKASCELDIVGEGNWKKFCMDLSIKLDISHRVRFWGQQPQDMVVQLFKKAQVVVVPSRWPEPFGLVGIEAMAHSRPVVAFNVGGISDWLIDGENGFLIEEQNTDQMANRISELLDNPNLACTFGENGYRLVREKYNQQAHLERLENFLQLA